MFFPNAMSSNFAHPRYFPAARAVQRLLAEAQVAASQRSCTIEQDDKSYTLSFDVPGVAREQLSIGIEGPVVRVEAKKDAPRQYLHVYELPQTIDASGSQAKLENGVLTLKLAKEVEASKVTELAIQ